MTQTRQEFTISRVLNAPRDTVWKAWTEADRLEQWWGPKGCKLRVIKLDLRPGGIFHYSMEFQPGHETYGRFIYREIVAPERIAFITSFADAKGNVIRAPFSEHWPLEVLNRLTLLENNGKTTLALRGGPLNANDAEWKMFVDMFDSMQKGFGGTFEQLDMYLAKA